MDLAAIVHPMDVKDFLTLTWGAQPALLEGARDRFTGLLDWPTLDRILTEQRHSYPRLRLSRQGTVIPVDDYTRPSSTGSAHRPIDPGRLYAHLRQGAMLVLDSVDEMVPAIRSMAYALEETFHEQVTVNAYVGWSDVEGFDLHWDDHDVIILQIFGEKEWSLYGSTRPWPLRKDIEANLEPPATSAKIVYVRAGDALYVPRGEWHQVKATETPSLHLTIGVMQKTGFDFVAWLAEDLLDSEAFRKDVPRHFPEKIRQEYFDGIRRELIRRLSMDALDRFLDTSDAIATFHPRISLDAVAAPDARPVSHESIEWLAPRAVLQRSEGSTRLSANGRTWTFADPAGSILGMLVRQKRVPLGELTASLADVAGAAQIEAFVIELRAAGLVTFGPS